MGAEPLLFLVIVTVALVLFAKELFPMDVTDRLSEYVSASGIKVDEADRGTAQALFQITAFGFGGTLSAVAAGYLFEAGAGPLMFGVAAVASTVVVVSVWFAFGRADAAE